MTATLCEEISKSFSNAINRDEFFGRETRSTLLDYLKLEQPMTGNLINGCKSNLYFGFFFDGTKNNYILAEPNKTHSNIARLYDCYPGLSVPGVLPKTTDWQYNPSRYTHFFRTYIPGVASPFSPVLDSGKGSDLKKGAATGYLGEARIAWALLQAINNVHRYFLQSPLLSPVEMTAFAKSIKLDKNYRRAMSTASSMKLGESSNVGDENTRVIFNEILGRLHGAVSQHWPDRHTGRPKKVDPGIVQKIHISIFGFSRGATQARAFTNWLMAICGLDAYLCGRPNSMTLGGFDVVFDFLGIFDTVASIGAGNTLGNSAPGRIFDGHGAWADAEENLRIPDNITCLHLVAAHEVRRSFPLDSVSVKGETPANCTEIVFPGVHSDIGCGYAPGEQGRGRSIDGNDMMTRIPLLVMYRAARLAGVPLKLELATVNAQRRFELTPDAIKAFNAYLSASQTKNASLTAIMREQQNYQMQWRLLRRPQGAAPMEKTDSYRRASTFDQNDLHSANMEFEMEITRFESWLQQKGKQFKPSGQKPGFANEHENEWEEIARWWKAPPKLDPAIAHFFDEYVHDSRAWFKLIPGHPDNEADTIAQLKSWDAKRVKFINDNAEASRRFALTHGDAIKQRALPDAQRGAVPDGLTDEQRAAAEEYSRTQKIPTMPTSGREPFESTSSSYFLSARGGYLRYRKIYGGWDSVLISQTEPVQEQAKNIA